MKKITLEDIASIETLVHTGKKRGLKYFQKANNEFSIQDLCKHWKISSATFYNVYSQKIGYIPRQNKKNMNSHKSIIKHTNNNILHTNLSSNVSTLLDNNKKEISNTINERISMEQFFRFTNCSNIEKVQETLLKLNSLLSDEYTYDIEVKMIQK